MLPRPSSQDLFDRAGDRVPQLTHIAVHDLLGQFDHVIEFPPDFEFVILHGQNGVGKTKILELVEATFNLNISTLSSTPFSSILYAFDDGATLNISKSEQLALTEVGEDDAGETFIRFELDTGADDAVVWDAKKKRQRIDERTLRRIESLAPLERVGPRLWREYNSTETLNLPEVLDRYPHVLPLSAVAAGKVPERMASFIGQINVHLIETQRLLQPPKRSSLGRREDGDAAIATVLQYKEDLKRQFREALALNSRTSQRLDRQFPRRLMTGTAPEEATDEAIRGRYEEQGKLRQRLAEISLLDTIEELPLPNRPLVDWERLVLWTYLEDTDEKLATFEPLLDRVDLLQAIVDSRFLHKKFVIDLEDGFYFLADTGQRINPTMLSSGEQHELVLAYDLLFNTKKNSLVLIDEPEISLHVTWQQAFLNDIIQISRLTDLRFMIATHSPQIVNKWWSRTAQLGPSEIPESSLE